MRENSVDIILPVYYEQDNIEKVINGIEKHVKAPHKITVVLQDKNDPTVKVLKKIQKKVKILNFIFTKDGIGMLKALKEGFKSTNLPIITMMMADLSDDPRDIDKMIKKINDGYDLVCASRYISPGKRLGGPKFKGFLSWLACISLRIATGIPTNDATNAFKTFRRRVIKQIEIQSSHGFEMPLELTTKAYKKGFKIGEVSTIWRDRQEGESKFKLWQNIPYYLRWYLYGIFNRTFDK